MYGAGFGVIRSVDQAFDPRVYERTRAHGTRFNGNKELTFSQTMITDGGTSVAQGHNLGVGAGIVIGDVPVPSTADNCSIANHYRTHGDFVLLQRPLGGAESFFHEEFVVLGVGMSFRRRQRVTPSDGA